MIRLDSDKRLAAVNKQELSEKDHQLLIDDSIETISNHNVDSKIIEKMPKKAARKKKAEPDYDFVLVRGYTKRVYGRRVKVPSHIRKVKR